MKNLRSWLRKQPQPVRVMLDGDPRRTVAVPPDGRGKWVELLGTLSTMEYETISCLDANGETLRATRYESDDDEDDKATPDIANLETTDGTAALVQCICNLVQSVRDMAAEASSRANTAEQAYSAAVVARANAEAAAYVAQNSPPAEGESDLARIASAFVGGEKRGAAVRAANGSSNGGSNGAAG